MNIDFLCKEYEEFYHFKCYVIWEAYQMLPIAHWPVRIQGIGEDMPNNMLSFINFEPLELYWTYFLAPQPWLPKFSWWDSWAWVMSQKWDDVLWAWTIGFDAFLCKYGPF